MKRIALTKWLSAAACVAVWGCFQVDTKDEELQRGKQTAVYAARQIAPAPADTLDGEEFVRLMEDLGFCSRFVNTFRLLLSCADNQTEECSQLERHLLDLARCAEFAGARFGADGPEFTTPEEALAFLNDVFACFCGGSFSPTRSPAGNGYNPTPSPVGSGYNSTPSPVGSGWSPQR
jgi:hypothetical protein